MRTSDVKPGDVVELKDKEGGFTDPDTGFDISRDQKVELGETIGTRTHTAILSGGLMVVSGGKSKSSKTDTKTVETDLPEDFPGRDAFIAAKMNLDSVKAFDFEKDKVAGVGAATIKSVQEYFSK